MGKNNLAAVLGANLLELVVDVLDDELGGVVDAKVWNEADRELALDRGGDDGLGAGGREGTLDTVERERGVAHTAHKLVVRSSFWKGYDSQS